MAHLSAMPSMALYAGDFAPMREDEREFVCRRAATRSPQLQVLDCYAANATFLHLRIRNPQTDAIILQPIARQWVEECRVGRVGADSQLDRAFSRAATLLGFTDNARSAAGQAEPLSPGEDNPNIRLCGATDTLKIRAIINDASETYQGTALAGRWNGPYMSNFELCQELEQGVVFWCWEEHGQPVAVMGIQRHQDAIVVRHIYVRADRQNHGLGGKLLVHLRERSPFPIFIGTSTDAVPLIRFCQKHDFRLVSPKERNQLLKKYWSVADDQIGNTVVLADQQWVESRRRLPVSA